MRCHLTFALAALGLAVIAASGQAQETTDRVLSFKTTTSEIDLQTYSTAIYAVAGVRPRINPSGPSLTVSGTADEIALSEWLAAAFEAAPATDTEIAAYECKFVKDGAPAARVFYLPGIETAPGLQEAVNVIRTIANVPRIVPLSAQKAVVMRGTLRQAALAEWLVAELEGPASTSASAHAAYEYVPENAREIDTAVRVFRLGAGANQGTLVETLNALRTETQIRRLLPYSARNAIAIRGTADQIAQTEQIIERVRAGVK